MPICFLYAVFCMFANATLVLVGMRRRDEDQVAWDGEVWLRIALTAGGAGALGGAATGEVLALTAPGVAAACASAARANRRAVRAAGGDAEFLLRSGVCPVLLLVHLVSTRGSDGLVRPALRSLVGLIRSVSRVPVQPDREYERAVPGVRQSRDVDAEAFVCVRRTGGRNLTNDWLMLAGFVGYVAFATAGLFLAGREHRRLDRVRWDYVIWLKIAGIAAVSGLIGGIAIGLTVELPSGGALAVGRIYGAPLSTVTWLGLAHWMRRDRPIRSAVIGLCSPLLASLVFCIPAGTLVTWYITLPVGLATGMLIHAVLPIEQAGRACQACGYDLTGNVSGRCPECGEAVPSHLQR